MEEKLRKVANFQFRRLYNLKIVSESDEQEPIYNKCAQSLPLKGKDNEEEEGKLLKYVVNSNSYEDAKLEEFHY